MMNSIIVRYPSYLDKFKCLGNKCIDNCCQDWKVYIDRETFNKYENIENNEIRKKIISNIHIINKSDLIYGTIKMEEKCPFLDSEGLCNIQNVYGIDYLSNVCRNYPRIINKINNVYEMSLDLSCIEAARIVLLNKEKVLIKERSEHDKKYYDNNLFNNFDFNNFDIGSNYQFICELRKKSIEIINLKEISLSDRLYSLGIFIEKAEKIITYEKDYASVLIKNYNKKIYLYNKQEENLLNMMELSFFKIIFKRNFWKMKNMGKKFEFLLKGIEETYGFNIENGIVNSCKKYSSVNYKFKSHILDKYGYIIDNYIKAIMFSELFPFEENDIMYNGYILLLFRISFIKLCICETYENKGKIDENDIVNIIQIITKEIYHRENISKEILLFLKENGLDNKKIVEILL